MADKSLSTIAQELWQGFGNNPRNVESFDTMANVFPPAMLYRGAKTLANTDFGAIKDALMGKYQISQTPKQDLQRAGQAITDLGFGAMDVAPAVPLVKPALKAAAPIAARQAVNLTERYGVSPTMNIIKPEGNLNLTTRLDEQIRGPETQTVFDLLKQVQGKPGVTKEGLKQIAAKYPDSAAKVTKQEFAESIPPSYYRKEDLATNNEELFDNYLNEAMDHMDYSDTFFNLGLPKRYHDDFDNVVSGHTEFSEIDPHTQQVLKLKFGLGDNVSDEEAFSTLGQHYMDQRHEEAYDYAMERAGGIYDGGYSYKDFQRLVPETENEKYFEFGVTHPEQAGKKYKHYAGESMPEGLIGHVRGSHLDAPTKIQGGIDVPANSYIIEEIQSDAQKGIEQTGPLHQVHGTLFKAAVQDALEKGADRIYLPTSYPISKVRHKHPEDYASIYDKAVVKEGLEPLSKIPGVEIKPIFKELESEHFFQNHPDYYEITMTPEAKEYILSGPGQQVPGYAAGGLVANDYDEEQIDQLANSIFETKPTEGGVSYRDYPNPYGLRAYPTKEGSYGGEMLPKTEGWAGEQKGRGQLKGSKVTEYSMDDERGSFPTINPLLSLDEIDAVAAGNVTPEIERKAIEWRDLQARHGQSAFKNPSGFAEGGVVDKIARAGRKGQYKIAELIGLRPEVEFATEIPERYYPANEQHNARGDAMRHMLLQAQLMQKYGETPAKIIGWMHENLSGPQGDAEKAMDEYNDRLGREIGRVAKDKADMAYRAMQAIDKQQAKTLTKEQMGEGYAEGGTVNTDLSKYGISTDQMQGLYNLADSSNFLERYQAANPVTATPDLNQLAAYYKEQSTVPKPVTTVPTTQLTAPTTQLTAPTTMPAAVQPQVAAPAPMYTRHEGMLFGDDFYDRYAQNVGGQFKDPYHNFLMTSARKIGPDADINRLYQQYQASGRTDTPDWATLDTTGPITKFPMLAHYWDASGGTPVERLSSAWNPTTPLIEGVTVPEGYWDAALAYNMNMSKIHPDVIAQGDYDVQQILDNNARAMYAMSQGEYGNQGKIFNSYLSPSQAAASQASRQASLANSQNYFNYMKNNNTAHAQMYGYSADEANSELDRLFEEMVARMEAEQAAENAMLASYTYGGGGGSSGFNFGYASPNTSSSGSFSSSSGYTPTNTNIGMGGVSGPVNYGGGTIAPKYAKGGEVKARGYAEGGLVYNDEEINNLADQLLGA